MGLLSPSEVQALHGALVDTYNYDSLMTLVMHTVGVNLERISLARDLDAVVTAVISEAESAGWLPQLLTEGSARRPHNQALSRLTATIEVRSALESPDPFQAHRVHGAPMTDREDLRVALKRLEMDDSARVLVVEGGSVSGKSYTLSLISYAAHRRRFALAAVNLEKLARRETVPIKAPVVGRSIALQLGLIGMPEPSEEQESRWVTDFTDWLPGALSSDPRPRWVVLDGFSRVPVSQGTEALIEELSDRTYVNLTSLRLVLLAYAKRDYLQCTVQGAIDYEYIKPIPRRELEAGLTSFFAEEYLERASLACTQVGNEELETRVATSVHRVLGHVKDDDPVRLLKLGRAVRDELALAGSSNAEV